MRVDVRRSFSAGVCLAVTAGLVVAANATGAQLTAEQKTAFDAVNRVVLRPLLREDHPNGLRVHLFNEELGPSVWVTPEEPEGATPTALVCQHRCLLFFVDRDPMAHFGHPVVIALWELEPDSPTIDDRIQWMHALWWPVIHDSGPPADGETGARVFRTSASRADRSERQRLGPPGVAEADRQMGTIVYDALPEAGIYDPGSHAAMSAADLPAEPPPEPGLHPPPTPGPSLVSSCGTWAVIVNGDNDETDSFDEDTNGMYAVLRGHRVPEDQIYYLSPLHPGNPTTPPEVDDYFQPTSVAHVQKTLQSLVPKNIDRSGRSCDELLLFSSSHGSRRLIDGTMTSVLKYVFEADYGGDVTPNQLNLWLRDIPCKKVTIVIEACKSGGFLPELAISTNPLFAQERFVFTSTSAAGTSHADQDLIGDPNPGDVGSETIWGYVEAFGASTADATSARREISFGEAVKYAIDNDIGYLQGQNAPQMHPAEPWNASVPQHATHSCYQESSPPDLSVARVALTDLTEPESDIAKPWGPPYVTIENTGEAPLSVGTVRLFAPKPSRWWQIGNSSTQPTGLGSSMDEILQRLHWPEDFQQIGNTKLLTGLAAGTTSRYRVEPSAATTLSNLTIPHLLVVVDSPLDPVLAGTMKLRAWLDLDDNVGTTVP